MSPSVVVIGAGVAGIAAAARLAHCGYQVTVVEKNSVPGGRCGQIRRDGHRFDIGATLYLMPEVFAEIYSALGEDVHKYLDLQRVDPAYVVNFKDGSQFTPLANLLALKAKLEQL